MRCCTCRREWGPLVARTYDDPYSSVLGLHLPGLHQQQEETSSGQDCRKRKSGWEYKLSRNSGGFKRRWVWVLVREQAVPQRASQGKRLHWKIPNSFENCGWCPREGWVSYQGISHGLLVRENTSTQIEDKPERFRKWLCQPAVSGRWWRGTEEEEDKEVRTPKEDKEVRTSKKLQKHLQ